MTPTEIPACVWKKAWRAAALEVIPEPAVKFDAHIWFEDVHDLSNSSLRAKRKRDSELPEDKILRLVKSAHTSRTCETSGHELFEASVDAAAQFHTTKTICPTIPWTISLKNQYFLMETNNIIDNFINKQYSLKKLNEFIDIVTNKPVFP